MSVRTTAEVTPDLLTIARRIRDNSQVRDRSTMIYPTLDFQKLSLLLREFDQAATEETAPSGGDSES